MMRRTILFAAVALAMLFVGPIGVQAQEVTTGTIEGTVTDPQGAPLPGVTVTITSAQGTKVETTDTAGDFRFAYLTAGTYGLTATLQGFTTVERQNLTVNLAARVRVEVVMTPGFKEKIEVVGTAPTVDITTATTGATISTALMNSVPLGRTFSNAVNMAPGVVFSGIDNANPSIAGASGLENTYMVDGVNIGNTGYGSSGSYSITFGSLGTGVNYDYIQEVQVKTGGYEPEFGEALGGFVNLVTKSGGNEVKGGVFGYYQGKGLEATRVTTDRINATNDVVSFQSYDYGFDAGGPVVKNKAFWYAAFDPTFTTTARKTPKAITANQGFSHELSADRNTYNYAGNVKWFANEKHTLSISAFGDPAVGPSGAQRPETVGNEAATLKYSKIEFGGNNVVGRWNGEISPNMFIEASVSYHQDRFKETPEQQFPFGQELTAAGTLNFGGVGFFEDSKSWRTTYMLKANHFLHNLGGEHSVRYGLEFQNIGYDHTADYSGTHIQLPNGLMSSTGFEWDINESRSRFRISRIRSGPITAGTTQQYSALFLSDEWSPVKWINIMGGIRYEREELIGSLTSFKWGKNWAPRVHVSVDPTRDNRTKASFAYGRFFGKVPNDLAVRALSSEVTYLIDYPLSAWDLSNPNNPRLLNPTDTIQTIVFGNQPEAIDPNSKLTFQDEYVVGLEREIMPNLNASVSYMYRKLGRTLEDVQLVPYTAIRDSGAAFGNYFITNPNPSIGSPNPTRKYNAFTVKVDKRFRERWQLLSSYTWSRLKGNYEGYYRRDNGQSDPFITSLFDFPYLKDPEIFQFTSEDGLLPNDRTHVFNAFGSYKFPFKLNVGASVTVASGTPITKLGYNDVYGNAGEIVLEHRGASGRTPTTGDFGLHADYEIPFKNSALQLVFDGFNLLNQQKAMDVDVAYELNGSLSHGGSVNEDFGHATLFQSPRQIRFAARLVR